MRRWVLRVNLRLAYEPGLRRWPRIQFSAERLWTR